MVRATVYLYVGWCTGKVLSLSSLSILYTLLLPLPVFQSSVAINGVPLVRRRARESQAQQAVGKSKRAV